MCCRGSWTSKFEVRESSRWGIYEIKHDRSYFSTGHKAFLNYLVFINEPIVICVSKEHTWEHISYIITAGLRTGSIRKVWGSSIGTYKWRKQNIAFILTFDYSHNLYPLCTQWKNSTIALSTGEITIHNRTTGEKERESKKRSCNIFLSGPPTLQELITNTDPDQWTSLLANARFKRRQSEIGTVSQPIVITITRYMCIYYFPTPGIQY